MPQENQATPRSGLSVQITVTKTIEYDIESRLQVDEIPPPLPSRMEDKVGFDPPELTEEEQRFRTLEHQMKQDLDI